MNVMIAADYSPPQSGNFIASVIALARRVAADGGAVIFVLPKERQWVNWIRDEGFPVEIVGKEGTDARTQFGVLGPLIEKYRTNILHLHFGMFHHAVTHHREELGDVKILLHDHMDFGVRSSIIKQYVSVLGHSFDYARKHIGVVAVMKRKYRAYFFLRRKWYVPNGLSMERYIDRSMTREECRQLLGVGAGEKVCLLLGWDPKLKGMDVAMKAVHECRRDDPSIVLGIIGAGRGAPAEHTVKFIRKETEFDPNESWIRYFHVYEDMFAVHRAIDVFLSASRRDAFSYGLLESISQNTPVVVSDIPGTKWATAYSKCVIFANGDAESCARAIRRAMQMGRNESNYQYICDDYSIDKWTSAMMEIYRKL